MIEFSSSFKLNEINIVDSPFNEDPKNMIFSREGRPKNLGKMGNNSYIMPDQILVKNGKTLFSGQNFTFL